MSVNLNPFVAAPCPTCYDVESSCLQMRSSEETRHTPCWGAGTHKCLEENRTAGGRIKREPETGAGPRRQRSYGVAFWIMMSVPSGRCLRFPSMTRVS